MGEPIAYSKGKGFARELVPGVWRLTGEVSSNLLDRLNFTARVLAGATMARVEDLDSSINPMSAQEILDNDARQHIGSMALDRGLQVPEDFVPTQETQLDA
jgi:hypothetical protein